ncbi:MAG: cell division protein FtsB [marine bacterium B5-7]|nr:MAG: cell division protein FtsB [marine bacterium B5-7]
MKWLVALLVTLFLLLQYKLWFEKGSVFSLLATHQKVVDLKKENEGLRQKNQTLAREIHDLKRGKQAVEGHARRDLGMIKKGETFYQVVK